MGPERKMDGWAHAETAVGQLAVDPALGNIRALVFAWGGRNLVPLHAAPWLDEPDIQADTSLLPVERQLSGDFLCAPFGASDLVAGPAHGWSANSAWTQHVAATGSLAFRLDRPVLGAQITKTLRLAPDAPLLYQDHRIEGGSGGLTVAHHPMIHLAGRGRCSARASEIERRERREPEKGEMRWWCESR